MNELLTDVQGSTCEAAALPSAPAEADRHGRPHTPSAPADDCVYRAFFDRAPDALLVVEPGSGRIVSANDQVAPLFGYTPAELIGERVEVLVPERSRDAHTRQRSGFATRAAARPMGLGLELWGRRKDGTEVAVDVSLSPIDTPGGQVVLAAVRDATERRRAEEAVLASERRFRRVFEDAPIGMAVLGPDERFGDVNQALCDALGLPRQELRSRTLSSLTPPEDVTRDAGMLDRLFDGDVSRFAIEKRLVTGAGRVLWTRISFSALQEPGTELRALAIIEDITERKQGEAHLAHLATHDELTGLANRTLLRERIQHAQARSRRTGQHYAVLLIDLDRFKAANDSFGHDVGDAVLAEVGHRIASTVRPPDTAARYGGDEFVVCCEDIGATAEEAHRSTEVVTDRLLAALRRPVATASHTVPVSASVGVVHALGNELDVTSLITAADAAMYRAKREGGDRAAWSP